MRSYVKELFSLSRLERGRVQDIQAEPKNLSPFGDLESMIAGSLEPAKQTIVSKRPDVLQTRSTKAPLFQDQALMDKLLKYRDQIPVSPRIIRASDS